MDLSLGVCFFFFLGYLHRPRVLQGSLGLTGRLVGRLGVLRAERNRAVCSKQSFNCNYEKLVEEISGVCCKCSKGVSPGAMEDHIKTNHKQVDNAIIIPPKNDPKNDLVQKKSTGTDKTKVPNPVVKVVRNAKCNLCAYISYSERCLELHIKRIHSPIFECEKCDKSSKKRPVYYNTIKQTHTNQTLNVSFVSLRLET